MHEDETAELSDKWCSVFTVVTIGVGAIDACFLFFFFMTTFYSDARGNVKNSEKILVYNVIVPDTILTVFIFVIVCPSTFNNKWTYSNLGTTWLGFVFIVSIYHASLAMATICNLISLSALRPHCYDSINKRRKMLILCLSYACLSICLCSFPATEKKGLLYNPFWFSPTITALDGYSGLFSVMSMTALTLYVYIISINGLQKVRKSYDVRKVPKKIQEDLNTTISFASLCLTHSIVLAMPMLVPIPSFVVCFIMRSIFYLSPVCRVLLLVRMCPHFKFVVDEDEDQAEMTEFLELSALK